MIESFLPSIPYFLQCVCVPFYLLSFQFPSSFLPSSLPFLLPPSRPSFVSSFQTPSLPSFLPLSCHSFLPCPHLGCYALKQACFIWLNKAITKMPCTCILILGLLSWPELYFGVKLNVVILLLKKDKYILNG